MEEKAGGRTDEGRMERLKFSRAPNATPEAFGLCISYEK